jgi:dTMP kinase
MIISDRSLISGIAYGLEFFNLLELEMFNSFATDKIYPDLVIILKLDKDTLQKRLSIKSHDNIEKRGVDYLLSIQENLIKTTNKLCIKNIIIDASLDIQTIHNKIVEQINVANN